MAAPPHRESLHRLRRQVQDRRSRSWTSSRRQSGPRKERVPGQPKRPTCSAYPAATVLRGVTDIERGGSANAAGSRSCDLTLDSIRGLSTSSVATCCGSGGVSFGSSGEGSGVATAAAGRCWSSRRPMNRMPRRPTVSMYRGALAQSPSANRRRLTALLRPISKSTNTSGAHNQSGVLDG